MEWDPQLQPGALPRLRAPDDGLAVSSRPPGLLGRRWLALVPTADESRAARITRGRTMARGGRVRAPWFSPGVAGAEVVDTAYHPARVRVEILDEPARERLVGVLLADLRHVAALLEGDLGESLLAALGAARVLLIPDPAEVHGDCDCGDFVRPCAHVAALHALVADAIDGDPFLLLTLRGLPPEQLFSDLREAWGDSQPEAGTLEVHDEPPPGGDWFTSAGGLPELTFQPRLAPSPAAGLRSLGPAPDGMDLVRPLAPLYEAGASAALALAHGEQDRAGPDSHAWKRKRFRGSTALALEETSVSEHERVESGGEDPLQEQATMARSSRKKAAPAAEAAVLPNDPGFTEALINTLADIGSAKSKQLADRLGVPLLAVRQELIDLEKLGIVYRTGQTRGTRWWLG